METGFPVHVKYIFRLLDLKTENEEQVSHLKYICKTLPIFSLYYLDRLKLMMHTRNCLLVTL